MVEHYAGDIYEQSVPRSTWRHKLRNGFFAIVDSLLIALIILIAFFPITLCIVGAGAIIFEMGRHL